MLLFSLLYSLQVGQMSYIYMSLPGCFVFSSRNSGGEMSRAQLDELESEMLVNRCKDIEPDDKKVCPSLCSTTCRARARRSYVCVDSFSRLCLPMRRLFTWTRLSPSQLFDVFIPFGSFRFAHAVFSIFLSKLFVYVSIYDVDFIVDFRFQLGKRGKKRRKRNSIVFLLLTLLWSWRWKWSGAYEVFLIAFEVFSLKHSW